MELVAKGWLVVRTHPQREAWACENIANQGAEFYFPRIATRRKIRAGKAMVVERIRSLFPGYVFVRNEGRWRFLLGTFGVSSVILQAGLPAIMPDSEVIRLRAMEDSEGFVALPKGPGDCRFKVGNKVRVANGTFSGFVGIYDGTSSRDRERVLLEYLGRKTAVLIGTDDLEEVV